MTPSLETNQAPSDTAGLRARLRDLRSPVTDGKATAPALLPESLGDPAFLREHGVRYAYATGAMANGIASEALVEAGAKAGLLSFFGAAGLPPARVEAAIDRLEKSLGARPRGFNLIHSPSETDLENAVCDLYLRRGVRLVEASAFMGLTPAIVRYRLHGIARGADGRVSAPNKVVAKVSRVEVAAKFLAPAGETLLREMAASGLLTSEQVSLAAEIPMAQDLTVEADSGGHTDNRPLIAMFPAMIALRDRLQAQHKFRDAARVGAAGGIATPDAAAAAYMMGAAYVMTGSVNQACVESGSSDKVRSMLAAAGQADCIMAPAADMFELGVKVQVLKRGTMFAQRGMKLYEIWKSSDSMEAIPAAVRASIEKDLFKENLDAVWASTREFFLKRDPSQVVRAESEPKHKLALVFRSYLGQASRWANAGVPDRVLDYQVWCGPAMGAFNEWTAGTFLAAPENRTVALVARNILYGAAVLTRAHFLRCQGLALTPDITRIEPLQAVELERNLD
ncbi:MAG: PfaD family polyunsaturated fatty acid/polyketide biosynthesis protein [Elusimicrobiota bacterium]|nr:PfaD family polyunsaturated fatty acid/polyketide biosynthesis protein [Elusimicrobiota bacterium]